MLSALESIKQKMFSMEEDTDTTAANYEQQISMMTEHVANMNEKLADRADEIQVQYLQ